MGASKQDADRPTEGVEMKSPLPLTGAVVLKRAAECVDDARKICQTLGEVDDAAALRGIIRDLEPIADRLRARQHVDA